MFVDQQAAELRWETLRQLAQHKRSDKPRVELWLLFAGGLFPRGLASQDAEGLRNAAFADRVSEMFGTQQWLEMQRARTSRGGVPRRVGPLDGAAVSHLTIILSHAYTGNVSRKHVRL